MARRRERRVGRAPTAALLLVALAVLTADLYVLSQRNVTTIIDLDEALDDFRTSPTAGAAPSMTSSPSTTDRAGSAETTQPSTASVGAAAVGSAAAPTTTAPADVPREAPRGATAYARPPQGVYTYRTTGSETVSVAGASHKYPERTYATIRHGDGCGWEYRNKVVAEHVDTLRWCSEPGQVLQLSQTRQVTFFGQQEGATSTCTPPLVLHALALAPAHRTEATCPADDGSTARLVRTFLRAEVQRVGGRAVEVVVIELRGTMTGTKRGTSLDTFWLAADTGLVIRWERSVDTVADTSFGASVRYREQATFMLESLTPAT